MSEASSETFGRYELIRRLAFGGMAEIFLASLRRDEGFEKRVVLKRILPQYSADQDFVRMFIDEAVLAARLSHPNIVQIYDFGNVEGVYFIAMEHVDGVDLRRVLRQADGTRRALNPAQASAIAEHIARGLSYAHNLADDDGRALQIIHRDVSPHNIMLSRSGEAKLMDFGIAKAEARATRTATGTIKGKVAYMAPEQAAGRAIDKRCDQFALGLVLWECLSGERMFEGASDMDMLRRVMACDVRPLRALKPDVPEALEQIVMRTLAERPEDRYPDASDLATALGSFRFSLGAAGAVDLAGFVDVAALAPASRGRRTLALSQGAPDGAGRAEEPSRPESASAATPALEVMVDVSVPGGWTSGTAREQEVTRTALASGGVEVPEPVSPVGRPPIVQAPGRAPRAWLAIGLVVGVLAVAAAVVVLVVNRRSEVSSTRVVAVPSQAASTLEVSSTPPGARILVDGLETGLMTPASIPGQAVGERVRLAVVLDGFQRWEEVVRIEAGKNRALAELRRPEPAPEAQQPAVTPESGRATPIRGSESRARKRGKRKQPARATPPAATGEGKLYLRSTTSWIDVYLGDRRLGHGSVNGATVPAGRLKLRLVNEREGVDEYVIVDVEAGKATHRTVSPKSR